MEKVEGVLGSLLGLVGADEVESKLEPTIQGVNELKKVG